VSERLRGWIGTARVRAWRSGFVLADLGVIGLSLYLAYLVRFDGSIPGRYLGTLVLTIPLAIVVKMLPLVVLRAYGFSWRYVGLREVASALLAATIGSAAFAASFYLLRDVQVLGLVPRSVLAIDYAFCVIGVSAVRLAGRLASLARPKERRRGEDAGRRALVVGAGDAGTSLVRSLQEGRPSPYVPVGFLDDDRGKWGLVIHGVRVLGGRAQLRQAAESSKAQAVLIAVPSTAGALVGETVAGAREAGIQDVRILPPLSELYGGAPRAAELREVTPEDVLRRAPVEIDTTEIEELVRGKAVLVTGAAGSIGSELCRQILRFGGAPLICVDCDETGMFHLERDLGRRFPEAAISFEIGDVRDRGRVHDVLGRGRPELVFHAAAYKHVPLMERAPSEAVKTNVFGTRCVIEEARAAGVASFVLISTDKAVNPCSIMGATKRVAELVVHAQNRAGPTRCVAVRFGNVLGSRGSVLPIFEEQIRSGGPVTITDPEMHRYFMVTSEAVQLVLQAATMGQGGEVFVLDMGEPVAILDLARDLIRAHGLRPDADIPIVYSGIRPGERLFEELLTAEEGTDATTHAKVFVARLSSGWEGAELVEGLERLRAAAESGDEAGIVAGLRELLPSFRAPHGPTDLPCDRSGGGER